MNKPRAFSSLKQTIWFCSDLHLGHEPNWKGADPLWKSRGFASIAEHDKWIKDQWRALVQPNDIVFNLGDATFTDSDYIKFSELSRLPGYQYLINGNHWSGQRQLYLDTLAKQYPNAHANGVMVYPLTANNLTFIGDVFETFIDRTAVFMQHRATYIWPEIGDGGYALVGHSHGRCEELNPANLTQGRILDVGVDNAIASNGTPFFTWSQIRAIMANKPVIKRDHH